MRRRAGYAERRLRSRITPTATIAATGSAKSQGAAARRDLAWSHAVALGDGESGTPAADEAGVGVCVPDAPGESFVLEVSPGVSSPPDDVDPGVFTPTGLGVPPPPPPPDPLMEAR
jgi:hypothetical protein